jgi:hypothetical protein
MSSNFNEDYKAYWKNLATTKTTDEINCIYLILFFN